MNIKLKAMLYTAAILLGFVGVSYLIVTITTMYPQVAAAILIIASASILIGMIYVAVLGSLESMEE
jgi:hypothetical protein